YPRLCRGAGRAYVSRFADRDAGQHQSDPRARTDSPGRWVRRTSVRCSRMERTDRPAERKTIHGPAGARRGGKTDTENEAVRQSTDRGFPLGPGMIGRDERWKI